VLIALTENNSEGQVRVQAFKRELEQLGWVDGRNIRIDYRWPGGNPERLRLEKEVECKQMSADA